VRNVLGDTLHYHELNRGNFPYPLQADLPIDSRWDAWWLLEAGTKVPDRFRAPVEWRDLWDKMVAQSLSR
jgi:hypothetical protein